MLAPLTFLLLLAPTFTLAAGTPGSLESLLNRLSPDKRSPAPAAGAMAAAERDMIKRQKDRADELEKRELINAGVDGSRMAKMLKKKSLEESGSKKPMKARHHAGKGGEKHKNNKRWVWATYIIQDDTPTSDIPAPGVNANLLTPSFDVATPVVVATPVINVPVAAVAVVTTTTTVAPVVVPSSTVAPSSSAKPATTSAATTTPLSKNGLACTSDYTCASGWCNNHKCTDGTTAGPRVGAPYHCHIDFNCGAAALCIGSHLPNDSNNLNCVLTDKTLVATKCTTAANCPSGAGCRNGKCYPFKGAYDPCLIDADCASNSCSTSTLTCAPAAGSSKREKRQHEHMHMKQKRSFTE